MRSNEPLQLMVGEPVVQRHVRHARHGRTHQRDRYRRAAGVEHRHVPTLRGLEQLRRLLGSRKQLCVGVVVVARRG